MKQKINELLNNRHIRRQYTDLNKHKANFINQVIACVGKSDRYYYWPLCLDDVRNKNSLEVDTCSTSYCVSILSVMKNRTQNNNWDEYIKGGLNTLLKLRLDNGSFPPVIETELLDKRLIQYNGGIAMSDNYFALTAFLDSGFLNQEFEYNDILPKHLKDFDSRVKFIFETIKFFGDNTIAQESTGGMESGWYYTNDKNAPGPVFLTTINIVILLNRILRILNEVPKFDYEKNYIKILVEKGINFLTFNATTLTSHGNGYYGIGEKLGFDKISLVHTCKMVDSFICADNPDLNEEIKDSLDKTILKMCKDWFFSDTYNYSERFQLLKNDRIKYQNILHESYPESVVLFTIINILTYSLSSTASADLKSSIADNIDIISETIGSLIQRLENQRSRIEQFNGFFKSHIRRNDGDYPIYASAESYKAIIAWEDLLNYLNTDIKLTTSEAISFQTTLKAQITRLQKYKNNPDFVANPNIYGSSLEACDPLIERLKAMLSTLSDSNYIEQQNIYDTTLLKKIQRIL